MAMTRRRWLHALSWLLLFASAVAAGVWVAAELGPERLRREAELALSELLGETRVGSVSLEWSGGPSITARQIEVVEEGETALSLASAELRLDLLRLFRGGGRFDRLLLQRLHLHLRRAADGTLRPVAIDRWLAENGAPPGDSANPMVQAGLREIEVRDATLRLSSEALDAEPATLLLEDFALHLVFGDTARLSASARLGAAALQLKAAGSVGAPQFNVSLEGLDLGAHAAWLHQFVPGVPSLLGALDASIRGAARGAEIEFSLFSFHLTEASVGEIELPALRASGSAGLGPHQFWLADLEVGVEELLVSGEGELTRPLEANSTLSGSLRSERLPFEALAEHAEQLGLVALAERITALGIGRLDAFHLDAEGIAADALAAWWGDPLQWPAGLRLETSFQSEEIPLEDGEPLRGVSGRVAIDIERLALREVRAKLGDRPLPTMTLEVDSWARLVGVEHTTPLEAVPPILGRPALIEWVRFNRGQEPKWHRAFLELDWIDHPALLGPLEQVSATLRPLAPGVEISLHRALWSNVWVSGNGRLSGEGDDGRIALRVQTHTHPPTGIGDPIGAVDEAVPAHRDGIHWASGSAIVEVKSVGPFSAREVRTPFRADGTRLWSDAVEIFLEPRGRLDGSLELDLSESSRVPYRAAFQVSDGDLPSLLTDLGLSGPATEGRIVIGALLDGHLRAGERMVASMRGPLSAHARDGVVHSRVPWAFAIAAVSETFNPFRSRESLPYEAIDGEFQFDAGRVEVQSFAITGPTLRLVATGVVELEAPYTMKVVAGLFLFRGIDKVIGGVPILSTLLLGSDENLVPAYFSLEGPWNQPEADLIPVKSFLAGPASIVAEGVPNFVLGGLNRLGRLFSIGPASREEPANPEAVP